MVNFRVDVVVTAILLAAMGITGLVQLGFVAKVVTWTNSDYAQRNTTNARSYSSSGSNAVYGNTDLRLLPLSLDQKSTVILFWTACGAFVDTVLLSYLAFAKRRSVGLDMRIGAGQKRWRLSITAICAVICFVAIARPLAVLIYAFIQLQKGQKFFDDLAKVDNRLANNRYTALPFLPFLSGESSGSSYQLKGYHTLETWTCRVPIYFNPNQLEALDVFNEICSQSKTARIILIPLLVFSVLLALSIFWRRSIIKAELSKVTAGGAHPTSDDETLQDYYRNSRDPETGRAEVEAKRFDPTNEVDSHAIAELPVGASEVAGDEKTHERLPN